MESRLSRYEYAQCRRRIWTIRQVCDLVKDDDGVLPDELVGELPDATHGDRRLLELLGRLRTYSTGSQCLLKLLDNRIKTFQTKR